MCTAQPIVCGFHDVLADRYVVGPTVFKVSMDPTLGAVGRVLNTLDDSCFNSLIGICQFLHAFVRRVLDCGEPLRIAGLASTLRTPLSRIVATPLPLCLFAP